METESGLNSRKKWTMHPDFTSAPACLCICQAPVQPTTPADSHMFSRYHMASDKTQLGKAREMNRKEVV